ncbi:MAG: hypothetical protein IKB79_00010 [Oscillospiraceae bacterium]|nr:hypothetical protein [Oscillospiraceae bacterium]
MFNIRKSLFFAVLAAAITLSGCTAPTERSSASQPLEDVSVPDLSVSQPAQPDVSVIQPDTPPAASVPEPAQPEPISPPAVSQPEPPCEHTKTVTSTVKAATCTAQGHENVVCAACGEVVISATIPPLGHTYETTVVEATCERSGSRTTTCSRCGDAQTETVPTLGHNWAEATCGSPATCKICGASSPDAAQHNWVVKYAMGTPECERCSTKYTFDKLTINQNCLNVPILAGTKSITLIDMSYRLSAFEGPFTGQSPCRLDITIEGIASNACTMTRGSHLLAADGTKINSIYDVHSATQPVCDGSFSETFSFDLPASEGTYTFVFSAQ